MILWIIIGVPVYFGFAVFVGKCIALGNSTPDQ